MKYFLKFLKTIVHVYFIIIFTIRKFIMILAPERNSSLLYK